MKIDLDKIQDKTFFAMQLSRTIDFLDKAVTEFKEDLEKEKPIFTPDLMKMYKKRADDFRYVLKRVNKAYSIEQNKEK